MKTPELKKALISLIGDSIDEASIPNINSFIEMDNAVIHYAGDGGEKHREGSGDRGRRRENVGLI